MKLLLAFLLLPFLFVQSALAYTLEQVQQHNTPDDCWMVFEDKVYDFSQYVPSHDKFMDIRQWCGLDMTDDFISKAGIGRDHRPGTYELLDEYYIGDIEVVLDEVAPPIVLDDVELISTEQPPIQEGLAKPRYNILIPSLITLLIYWVPYFLIKKKVLNIQMRRFNGFFNSMLFLFFLIPVFGFGLIMVLQYNFPTLAEIDIDFMYWHVQLSFVMSMLGFSHLALRLNQFKAQLRK